MTRAQGTDHDQGTRNIIMTKAQGTDHDQGTGNVLCLKAQESCRLGLRHRKYTMQDEVVNKL